MPIIKYKIIPSIFPLKFDNNSCSVITFNISRVLFIIFYNSFSTLSVPIFLFYVHQSSSSSSVLFIRSSHLSTSSAHPYRFSIFPYIYFFFTFHYLLYFHLILLISSLALITSHAYRVIKNFSTNILYYYIRWNILFLCSHLFLSLFSYRTE